MSLSLAEYLPQQEKTTISTSSSVRLTSKDDLGAGYTAYNYVSSDGKYGIKFFAPTITPEFDAGYVLERTEETIDGLVVTYAFHEKTTLGNTVTTEAYEALQFMFDFEDKRYAGFIRRGEAKGDKEGLRLSMREFIEQAPWKE